MSQRYCLITPCRDEALYAQQTLESVVAQTIPPAKWVIVDDGSKIRQQRLFLLMRQSIPTFSLLSATTGASVRSAQASSTPFIQATVKSIQMIMTISVKSILTSISHLLISKTSSSAWNQIPALAQPVESLIIALEPTDLSVKDVATKCLSV